MIPASRSLDERFMAAAVRLARRHLGATTPNPSVGAIVVADDGRGPRVVGRAVTARGGRPHAEPQALAEAGGLARGATLYSTLEPCSHHGKTPPCVDAIVAAGVARVVTAVLDPDPRVAGRGCRLLREAGIVVDVGVGAREAEAGLSGFLTHRRLGRPRVTLKLAISADGAVGVPGVAQAAVTGEAARAHAQATRLESDAILVGIGTALADDPRLTVRLDGLADRSPTRVVLDGEARLPLASALAREAGTHPLVVVTSAAAPEARVRALRAVGATVVAAKTGADGRIDLADALRLLGLYGHMSLVVEGGAAVAAAFLAAGLVDEIHRYDGAAVLGPGATAAPSALVGAGPLGHGFAPVETRPLGPDRFTRFLAEPRKA